MVVQWNLPNTFHYINNWLKFLFVVKATSLKQQIVKFNPYLISTEASYNIYTSQCSIRNVKANFCAYKVFTQ